MSDGVIIRTERLVLREFRPDDWESVHEYAVDPDVFHYMPWGPNSEDETRAFICRAMDARKEDPRLSFELAITLAENGRLIGGGGIRADDESFRSANMGYCLRRDAWGAGLGTESAVALISYGFEKLGVHRIWATCDSGNVRSARVLEKSGMRLEGTRRDDTWVRERWRSTHIFAVLEAEWRPGNAQNTGRIDGLSSEEEDDR